jgi:hypothetical protein
LKLKRAEIFSPGAAHVILKRHLQEVHQQCGDITEDEEEDNENQRNGVRIIWKTNTKRKEK